MSVPFILLSIIYIAVSVGLIVIILMQKKRSAGLGSVAGMGDSQTYWDKNKGRSLEGALEKYSKILGAVFMILSLVLCLVR